MSPVKQTLVTNTTESLPVLQRGKDAVRTTLAVAGELWCRSYSIDLTSTIDRSEAKVDQPSLLADAPTYSWDHGAEHIAFGSILVKTYWAVRWKVRVSLHGCTSCVCPRIPGWSIIRYSKGSHSAITHSDSIRHDLVLRTAVLD